MNAIGALTALVLVLAGSALVTKSPDAKPIALGVEVRGKISAHCRQENRQM